MSNWMDVVQTSSDRFEKLPKIGEKKEYNVMSIRKEEKATAKFKGGFWIEGKRTETLANGEKLEVSTDWRLVLDLADDKLLTISQLAPINQLKKAQIVSGKILIDHPEKGKWVVTKMA